MSPTLLFDIDRTLFDTERFSKDYREKFIKFFNTTPEKFEIIRSKYHRSLTKHTDYVPEEFFKHLINSFHRDKQRETYEKLHNLFYETKNFSKNLYPETVSCLQAMKTRYLLGTFSEGHPPYQKTKLVKASIYDFFDPKLIYISRRKTDPAFLSTLPEKCTIVDDDSSVIDELINQKIISLIPVWLNRNNKDRHPRSKTIHSLDELL